MINWNIPLSRSAHEWAAGVDCFLQQGGTPQIGFGAMLQQAIFFENLQVWPRLPCLRISGRYVLLVILAFCGIINMV